MDSKPDDHDPDLPAVGSAEDLEEALKWLEDLTARQSKSTDLSNPVPAASLDSPFRGLIDDETGDLPDWLREAPATPDDDSFGEGDAESRLDWLAKMAQRESIEELPTLEWRRLSEPVQSAIMARGPEPQAEAQDATSPAETELPPPEQEDQLPAELLPDSAIDIQELEASAAEAVVDDWVAATAPIDEVSAGEDLPADPPAVAPDVVAAAEEELRLTIEAGEELPPLDDLDAAMAWIEELAASQDAPIEDIPSVADRALASKLMMEAGLSPEGSIMDELGSDSGLVEGLTPTHPFIEEEDFADTVVLVETIVADQGIFFETPERTPEAELEAIPAEPTLPATPGLDEFLPPADTEEVPEAMSFDDAMAILDEIAVAQQGEIESVGEPLTEPLLAEEEEDLAKTARDLAETMAVEASAVAIIEPAAGETAPLSAEEAPWNEAPDEATGVVESPIEGEGIGPIVAALALETREETPTAELETEAAELDMALPEPEEELAWSEPPDEVLALAESHADAPPALETQEETPSPELEAEAAEPDMSPSEPEEELAWSESPEGEPDLVVANGQDNGALEAALASLDALALPTGRTLEDLNERLQTAQLTPWRDVTSALDWLESALAAQPSPVPAPADVAPAREGEAGWFDQMPEDPDAVLAWLEQMAAAEERGAAPPAPADSVTTDVVEAESPSTTAPELGEADLLAMPDDPDEAMAWLESLAHGGPPPASPSTSEAAQPVEAELEDVVPQPGWPVEEDGAIAVGEVPETAQTFGEEQGAANDFLPETIWPVEEDVATAVEVVEETTQPVADEVAEMEDVVESAEGTLDDVTADVVPTDEAVAPAEEAHAAPKRPRGRPRKTALSSSPADATPPAAPQPAVESTEPAAESEEPADEPPVPPAKPRKSWVDLLKPLD